MSKKQTKEPKHYDVNVKIRNFCSKSKLFFIISLALVVIALLSTFTGVDIALEFKGGTIITYGYVGEIDTGTVESEISTLIGSSVTVQQGDSLDSDTHTLSLSFSSTEGLTAERQSEVTDTIAALYPDSELEVLDSNDVNATSGSEFFTKCIVAAIFAALILILYIALRFKQISGWSAGVCAVIGLLSTLIVTYGGVVLMGFEIDSNFMAVILTLLGYSINDTIVIYDRIRENQVTMPGMKIEELVNISSSQSLKRTLRTSITTFGSMLIVSVVSAVMGLDSILSFSIPIMVGIVMGSYNSICFVPSLWVWWQKRRGITILKPAKKVAKLKV
ncbi:MAG: protein translocase subunit SecF [Ruminococcus sp.]|nr:protein translocase subunit SecF [Ruminococcus sp.]